MDTHNYIDNISDIHNFRSDHFVRKGQIKKTQRLDACRYSIHDDVQNEWMRISILKSKTKILKYLCYFSYIVLLRCTRSNTTFLQQDIKPSKVLF